MRVLIVAPDQDLHATVVAQRLAERGVDSATWETAYFPWRQRISWRPPGIATLFRLTSAADTLDDYSVIWWRRFRAPTTSPTIIDPDVRRFCLSEAKALLSGVFQTTSCMTVNDPDAERRANNKLLQLHIALQCGLTIPHSIISNQRSDILEFLGEHERSVCKTLVCDYVHGIPTRICTTADFAVEDEVSLAPAIVQELIEAKLDIRAFVVGETVFAVELARDDINTRVDWRSYTRRWQAHTLPPAICERIRLVAARLGLSMASLDFRLSVRDEYVFLEVNPNGQFLFLEIDAGLPVTAAVADHLIKMGRSAAIPTTQAGRVG